MKTMRGIISANIEKHSHFEEYFKIIDIIQANEFKNPDICIESCKALIEGISKTIFLNLDNTISAEDICNDNLPKLFKQSINLLSTRCEDIEGEFAIRFSGIIKVLGEIRNKRGDISHGRVAPKVIFSSCKLATTVKNMTESMLVYVLEHYFTIDFSNDMLIYKDLEEYNSWLDDNTDFPIKKAKYSQLLYENDIDEYENRYNNEFLMIQDNAEEDEVEQMIPEINKEAKQAEGEVKSLVGTFSEEEFWTNAINKQTKVFSEKENLKISELRRIISDYLFSENKPLRDEVFDAMLDKPSLATRATLLEDLIARIIIFVDTLKGIHKKS